MASVDGCPHQTFKLRHKRIDASGVVPERVSRANSWSVVEGVLFLTEFQELVKACLPLEGRPFVKLFNSVANAGRDRCVNER